MLSSSAYVRFTGRSQLLSLLCCCPVLSSQPQLSLNCAVSTEGSTTTYPLISCPPQADLAELLNVPQSSISRIEQRTDMYLSTLRNYVQAMGGVLQIQAVFPEGGAIIINRFGDYEDQPYMVVVRTEKNEE